MRFKTIVITLGLACSIPCVADELHYAIILDAGSSSTRLHLYCYEMQQNLPNITEIFTENIKPGLPSFTDPNQAGPSLKKLLDDAEIKLQSLSVDTRSVSLNLLATAGMRLLPIDRQTAIYHSIKNYLHDHYHYQVNHIETMTGQYEGLYAWLAVNYRVHTFDENANTYGIIDMGDASTQIAYATQDTSQAQNELQLDIANKHYTIFSKSFLGLGLDQARAAMNASQYKNYCYPTGYSDGKTIDGQYDFNVCNMAYADVVAPFDTQALAAFGETDFAVLSGAYYTYQFFGVEDASQDALITRINMICTMPWNDMMIEYQDDIHVSEYCANGIYLNQLFYQHYHLQPQHMWITNHLREKQEFDWALGALIYQTLAQSIPFALENANLGFVMQA